MGRNSDNGFGEEGAETLVLFNWVCRFVPVKGRKEKNSEFEKMACLDNKLLLCVKFKSLSCNIQLFLVFV